jgi:hypothetical protein
MDGNYEWQKFQTNERVGARRWDAAVSRMAERGGKARSPHLSLVTVRVKAAFSILEQLFYRNHSRPAKRECLV